MLTRRQSTSLSGAIGLFLTTCVGTIQSFADSTTTTSQTTTPAVTTTTWYATPWIWAVTGGLFVIIVIALATPRNKNG
jgi:hypothetical protein